MRRELSKDEFIIEFRGGIFHDWTRKGKDLLSDAEILGSALWNEKVIFCCLMTVNW